MPKEYDPIKTGHYDSVQIEVYDTKFSLAGLSNGQQDGVTYKLWAYPQKLKSKGGGPEEKARPVKVYLGDSKDEAMKTIALLYHQLKGE